MWEPWNPTGCSVDVGKPLGEQRRRAAHAHPIWESGGQKPYISSRSCQMLSGVAEYCSLSIESCR